MELGKKEATSTNVHVMLDIVSSYESRRMNSSFKSHPVGLHLNSYAAG